MEPCASSYDRLKFTTFRRWSLGRRVIWPFEVYCFSKTESCASSYGHLKFTCFYSCSKMEPCASSYGRLIFTSFENGALLLLLSFNIKVYNVSNDAAILALVSNVKGFAIRVGPDIIR